MKLMAANLMPFGANLRPWEQIGGAGGRSANHESKSEALGIKSEAGAILRLMGANLRPMRASLRIMGASMSPLRANLSPWKQI